MGRPKKNKDPFEDLPSEWRDSVSGMGREQIDEEIAKVAKNEDENQRAKKDDPDLQNLKWQVKEASAPYREATKMNKLKISYAIQVLGDKGAA